MNATLGSTRLSRRAGRTAAVSVTAMALSLATFAASASTAGVNTSRTGGSRTPAGPSIHSSDGVVGPMAAPVPAARRTPATISDEKSYRVAPGLRFRQWDQQDDRGPIRAYLLRANLNRPGLSLQYAGPEQVADRDELSDLLATDGAVAGVNGDFFDIHDTAAPLGVGIDESRILHGPGQGWMTSFLVPDRGRPLVGQVPVRASVPTRPDLGITNLNSPRIVPDGIGVYTRRWGLAPGYHVTDGAKRKYVRQVVVRGGVVVSNTVAVSSGSAIQGRILIGRGSGAARLNRQLPVGTHVRLVVDVDSAPRLAISGSTILLHNGRLRTHDDGELHPRTAVGVDTDTGRVLLLVVDGRQDFSRGYTLLELARLMRQLGAEEALNLDGGGSSTMVSTRPSGRTRVANSPSDGAERRVANGLELVYETP